MGSSWYSVLLAELYLGFVFMGFRCGQAVFVLVTSLGWSTHLKEDSSLPWCSLTDSAVETFAAPRTSRGAATTAPSTFCLVCKLTIWTRTKHRAVLNRLHATLMFQSTGAQNSMFLFFFSGAPNTFFFPPERTFFQKSVFSSSFLWQFAYKFESPLDVNCYHGV